jgi:uncharacterized Zn finger protein
MNSVARTPRRPRNVPAEAECSNCGQALIAPEWVAYVGEDVLWSVWSCDTCGHWHEARVKLSSSRKAVAPAA